MGATQPAEEPERDHEEDVDICERSETERDASEVSFAPHSRHHSPHDQPHPIHPRPLLRGEHKLRAAKPRAEAVHLLVRDVLELLDRGVFRRVTQVCGEFTCAPTKAFDDGLDLGGQSVRSGGGGGLEGGVSIWFCRRRGGGRGTLLWCVGEIPAPLETPETPWASPSPPMSLDWERGFAPPAPIGLWSAASPDPARTGAPLLVGLPLLMPKEGGGADDAEGVEVFFSGVPTGGTTRSCPSAERRAARGVGDSPGLKRGDECGSMMGRVGLAGRVAASEVGDGRKAVGGRERGWFDDSRCCCCRC